jgi:hypothetical protein
MEPINQLMVNEKRYSSFHKRSDSFAAANYPAAKKIDLIGGRAAARAAACPNAAQAARATMTLR